MIVVICGPTAAGKTAWFEKLKAEQPGVFEYINADTGQMYRGLSVGTAKPNLRELKEPETYHLFDTLDLGQLFAAGEFRRVVGARVEEIWARAKTPVIVGGSMFYISALFFPPRAVNSALANHAEQNASRDLTSTDLLYQELISIDPRRASAIMPADRFRILRALEIWATHKVRPSTLVPSFHPLAPTALIFLCPKREVLDVRIHQRLKSMLEPKAGELSWLEEAEKIYSCPAARIFVSSKRLIGYKEICDWIEQGRRPDQLPALEKQLFMATRNYSKQQIKFWRSLQRKIREQKNSALISIIHAE